jgi:ribosomal protein L7/L12
VADRESPATRVLDEIEALLKRGNKTAAIKVYRTATGVGLKEAKDAVDAVESAMQARGAIEVDRAKSTGVFGGVLRALSRWRGQND